VSRLRVLLLLVLAWAVAGCMSMPTSGPVVEADDPGADQGEAPADIVVRPPQPGESARDIVVHFLEAMEASPISTTVAREFLSAEAASAWTPELGTIVYGSKSVPRGTNPVTIELDGAGRLGAGGRWRGPLSAEDSRLEFPMVREDGEWRIAEAPDALIVRDFWFAQRFRQVSVYFLDPSSQVLVPEPVYLPTGDQLPTYLVRNLIAGPGPGLTDVEKSLFPSGTTVRPVTVDARGRAQVALQGDPAQFPPRNAELVLAQLTWTLRQVPDIRFLVVTVGDEPLRLTDGSTAEVPIDQGSEFDPSGSSAPTEPFALRRGLLVTGPLSDPRPVAGPFGRLELGLRSIAVDPRSDGVAGVTEDGERLFMGQLHGGAAAQEVVKDAVDLLPPSWDLAGRLWLVDRRPGGALISAVVRGRAQAVVVPGITGRQVKAFVVSRDGTRLVAVLSGPSRDEIVQSRVRVTGRKQLSATQARRLPFDDQLTSRVRDVSWSSPTALLLLTPLGPNISEVRPLSVDGSPASGLPSGTTVRGNMRWLAGSPVAGEPWYAVSTSPRSVLDSSGVEYAGTLEDVQLATLTYAG
jgi:Lipoprotein LpqB beta-propeller domain/Sporulation and spore germination